MTQAFAIEIGGRSAGIAVAERGGFVFHAADRAFRELDRRSFTRLRHIERAAERIVVAQAA